MSKLSTPLTSRLTDTVGANPKPLVGLSGPLGQRTLKREG